VEPVYERMVEVLWAFYERQEDGTPQTAAMALVRLQDRFRVASYSSGHEISDLRTYALER
jgi:hypothetical protein